MKSKKTLALVMALAMCLTAIALPASAAGGLVLSVEKTQFAPGEKFETTVSGITAENNRGNIIAVAQFPMAKFTLLIGCYTSRVPKLSLRKTLLSKMIT